MICVRSRSLVPDNITVAPLAAVLESVTRRSQMPATAIQMLLVEHMAEYQVPYSDIKRESRWSD
jgi:hypothetical protein